MRLDKYLANAGIGTRSEVKQYIKKGLIRIGDETAKKPEIHIDEKKDRIFYQNRPVQYETYTYYMLNKPSGVISATTDSKEKTVLDLPSLSGKKDLFPVGRLDKDTEGLLLMTNDGDLAHNLLSPKKHVGKRYFARIEGEVTDEDVSLFEKGLVISEDFTTLPAHLTILSSGEISEIEVEIYEGKFHQVKRMFHAVGKEVLYLKRLSMGSLTLDPTLPLGEARPLTEEELASLK